MAVKGERTPNGMDSSLRLDSVTNHETLSVRVTVRNRTSMCLESSVRQVCFYIGWSAALQKYRPSTAGLPEVLMVLPTSP